jgi:hypothetical protein
MTVPSYSYGIHNLRGDQGPGNPPTEKLCSRCDRWLPLEGFRPNPRMRSGLNSWCKECQLERTRQWRAKNSESVRAYNEKRRAEYPATRRNKYPATRRSPSYHRSRSAA